MKNIRLLICGVPFFAMLAWSCQPSLLSSPSARFSSLQNAESLEGSLSEQLRQRLMTLSPAQGLSFFTQPESHQLRSIPQDPNNPLTPEKVALGQWLYHDTALGSKSVLSEGMATYSCATCHHARAGFQSGLRQGIGDGGVGFGLKGEARQKHSALSPSQLDVQPIRTPTAMNGAWQQNMLWNGQFGARGANMGTQSLWSVTQAQTTTLFAGIENNRLGFDGIETQAIAGQNVHRLDWEVVKKYPAYQRQFALAYSGLPPAEQINNVTMGLAIAAFERTILSNQAPFQLWLKGNKKALDAQSLRGALLFFGKANCFQCHTGPALNSMRFESLGLNDLTGTDILGSNPAADQHLGRGGFTRRQEDMFKFKVPQLYNLIDAPFYGHGGSIQSLADFVSYLNRGVAENPKVPSTQLSPLLKPLGLSLQEQGDLVYFLSIGLRDPNLRRYEPRQVPSGHCIPNHDSLSRQQLNCD